MKMARGLTTVAAALWLAALGHDRLDRWIDATPMPSLAVATSAEVVDRAGTLLRAFTVDDGRWRLAAGPGDVDPLFLRMLLAYEDRRFYVHAGVDPRAVLRAAGQALWSGHVVSGGSTLTMQVARLVEDGPTGRWGAKLRQTRLALALERHLTKAQILTLYLERAPYGGNVEGIRAAARTWFGKEPRRLTPAEAALLVALPQSPEARRPDRHPDAARAARDRVLDRMQAAGVLDAATVAAARRAAVPDAARPVPALAPHLSRRLHDAQPDLPRIATTLDATVQAALERLAARAARDAGDRISIAIVAADHRTGAVLASVGSAGQGDARDGWIDMTTALRSPGSTLKPFAYALAFDAGLAAPETLIDDRPTAFGSYAPQNFDGRFRGTVSLRQALQLSLNIPAVKLAEAIGPGRLTAFLQAAGARLAIPGDRPGLAVVLGGLGTDLDSLVGLYATLAEGGRRVLLHDRPEAPCPGCGQPLLRPESAWSVADILAGMPPPAGGLPDRIAYKTGTSYGHRDAWAVGFDGRDVVGVWMGRPDGTPVPGAFGGELAAPVLFEAFSRLKPGLDPLPPPPPGTVVASNAALPRPMQVFAPRDALFRPAEDAPAVAFPPDGAVLPAGPQLLLKVRDGVAPFTWLADGRPLATGLRDRQAVVPAPGRGFLDLTVIDARGRAARSRVEVR